MRDRGWRMIIIPVYKPYKAVCKIAALFVVVNSVGGYFMRRIFYRDYDQVERLKRDTGSNSRPLRLSLATSRELSDCMTLAVSDHAQLNQLLKSLAKSVSFEQLNCVVVAESFPKAHLEDHIRAAVLTLPSAAVSVIEGGQKAPFPRDSVMLFDREGNCLLQKSLAEGPQELLMLILAIRNKYLQEKFVQSLSL